MTDPITREERERLPEHISQEGALTAFEARQLWGAYKAVINALDKTQGRLTAAEEKAERMRNALEPFRTVGRIIDRMHDAGTFDREDDEPFTPGCAWIRDGEKKTLTWGDFRRARKAFEEG